MKTPADISAASAAAATEDEGTQFLPDDKNYRLTGELPAEKKDDSASSKNEDEGEGEGAGGEGEELELENEGEGEGAENQDDSASSKEKADTAAASAAATAQKKPGTKTPATSENRWQKITRENRELREKNARLEGRDEGRSSAQPRETVQASQPAAEGADRPEPQIGDIDPKTNKPKYATLAEYLSDLRKWDRDQSRKEFAEMSTKTQHEQRLAENERIIEQTVNQRAATARKTHADFDDVLETALELKNEHGQDAFFYAKGSPIDGFFLDSDRGHDVMYAIAKDFDKHGHIFARDAKGNFLLNPVRQLRELSKIENSLPDKPAAGKPGASSAKPVTQAPPPPHQTGGTGSASKDVVQKAVEDNDYETYAATANARALEKRRGTKRPAAAR